MPDGIRWVGLDVHARESTLAVFDQATSEVVTRRVVGRPHELLPWLRGVERPARMVYEAGPTGYGLARRALAEGIELGVCAPGKTERPPADRIKTDKRDAIRLARLLAAGELTLVRIPSVEREQLRDLVRCREDIRVDLMRARHRIGKFLLRREIYYEGPGETWSRKHRSWLTSVRFADQASRATLADYLHAHDVLIARRDQVEAQLAQLALGVLGVLIITAEYSTGMIRASFTAVPKRLPVLWAKAGVFAFVTFALMLPAVLVAFFVGQAILAGHNIDVGFTAPHVIRVLVGAALYLTVVGLFGLGLGGIVRNTAGGIASFAAIMFVLPPLMNVLPTSWNNAASPYLPLQAGEAILSTTPGGHHLSPWVGLALFAGYAAAAIAVAAVLLVRRDT